jgi:hypothetical protein
MREKLSIINVLLSTITKATAPGLSALASIRNSPNANYRYNPSIIPDLSNSWMKRAFMKSRELAVGAAGSYFAKSSRIVLKPSAEG